MLFNEHAMFVLPLLHLLLLVHVVNVGGSRHREKGKKVVIIGDMNDMADLVENKSFSFRERYSEEDERIGARSGMRLRRGHGPLPLKRKTLPGSFFVPVAAYSVTKSIPSNAYSRRQGIAKQTESAVYGYMQRPEIIEFRGQYFYEKDGNNNGVVQPHPSIKALTAAPSTQYVSSAITNGKQKTPGGLGPGGLLLATLPLILAPMLSYLFTPMVIPITATVAAGRKKRNINLEDTDEKMPPLMTNVETRRAGSDATGKKAVKSAYKEPYAQFDRSGALLDEFKEAQIVTDYLRRIHYNEKDRDKAIAVFLQCEGMLNANDDCLQRLSCEFSDPNSYSAPELDRAVTSILLGHILSNDYIPEVFKKKLKNAANFGRNNTGQCRKYSCHRIHQ